MYGYTGRYEYLYVSNMPLINGVFEHPYDVNLMQIHQDLQAQAAAG